MLYYQNNTHQYAEACLTFEENRKEIEKQMKTKKGGKKPKFAGFPKQPITTPTKQVIMQDENEATLKKEKKEKEEMLSAPRQNNPLNDQPPIDNLE